MRQENPAQPDGSDVTAPAQQRTLTHRIVFYVATLLAAPALAIGHIQDGHWAVWYGRVSVIGWLAVFAGGVGFVVAALVRGIRTGKWTLD